MPLRDDPSSRLPQLRLQAPGTTYAITVQRIERWLVAGATTNPNESIKNAKLKMLLVKR